MVELSTKADNANQVAVIEKQWCSYYLQAT